MLSMSAAVATSSESSSADIIWSKKLVGGSWLVSPITTAVLALRNAPRASSGLTCYASSKITTSNWSWLLLGSRYWAIERGLIMKQGFILFTVPPASFRSFLRGI